jgi:hypothetical protein
MIVLGYIEFHLKGYAGWIIVMKLGVLLIMYYLIWEILVEAILDVHIKGVKKVSQSRCYYDASSTKKVYEKILVLVYSQKTICSLRYHAWQKRWLGQLLILAMCMKL